MRYPGNNLGEQVVSSNPSPLGCSVSSGFGGGVWLLMVVWLQFGVDGLIVRATMGLYYTLRGAVVARQIVRVACP